MSALTVQELIDLLSTLDPHQRVVMSDLRFGDFDVTGYTGARLSEDNFKSDIRPILRLQKRSD